MLGIKTRDGTYVWLDERGRVRASGILERDWKRRLAARHPLPDYDAKERLEQSYAARGEFIIAEPCDVMRAVRSFGELVEVMRRLSSDFEEYVQVPAERLRRSI